MSAIKSARKHTKLTLAAAICALNLVACSTVPRGPAGFDLSTPAGVAAHADHLIENQQFEEAAAQYGKLALLEQDPLRSMHYQLVEAEILFTHKFEEQGALLTGMLPEEMPTPEFATRRQLLVAATQLYNQQPSEALLSLPEASELSDAKTLIRYHDLRFRAGAALNEATPMLDSLIALDELEQGEFREIRNGQIWQLLNSRDELSLERLNANASVSRVHTGWLALLQAVHNSDTLNSNPLSTTPSAIDMWQQAFADHPATEMLAAYEGNIAELSQFGAPSGEISLIGTDAIAMLLPFEDRIAIFSNAIRDGFISAMLDSGSNRQVRIYNVGANASDAVSAYRQAVQDGAQLVVGPLRRNAVEALTRYGSLDVPVVSLNYLPYGGSENLIQFGMSPEDEARDAARFMVQAGLKTAAMVLPDSDSGARSGEAFKAELESWGGEVVASETLDTSRNDYRKELSALLMINDSLQRRRNIQSALDTNLVFETRTRTDLDAIFAPVKPSIGRVLKPQLNFHSAGHIPLLASSAVFSGIASPETDNDLNGVLFNDMPWIIGKRTSSERQLRADAKQLKLDKGPLSRFFALGADAHAIIEQLGPMLSDSTYAVQGSTGQLSLSTDRRVQRQLKWAKFEEGAPKAISFKPLPMNAAPVTGSLINPKVSRRALDKQSSFIPQIQQPNNIDPRLIEVSDETQR